MDTEREINELKRRLSSLENKPKEGAFLDRYLDNQSKDIINQVVQKELHDSLWDRLFYLSSFSTANVTISLRTFTVTIASPAVATYVVGATATAHDLVNGNRLKLYTTGALPTGLDTSTTYYVVSKTSTTFQLSLTLGGTAINTSGSQSGTHTYMLLESLDQNARESDTSAGKRFLPSKPCRFKLSFYLNSGISKSTVYIVAPAKSLVSTQPSSIINSNTSFVGVKIVHGAVSLVSSVSGTETLLATSTTITDATTHILEIDYEVSHARVLFDGNIIGDITCNLGSDTLEVFFPYLTSVASDDGTEVNLTIESYEFIQKK